MEKNKDMSATQEGLKKDLEDYIDTRIDVIKLKAIEKAGIAAGNTVTAVSASVLGYFFLLFLSLALALLLAQIFDSYAGGFACVAGLYGCIGAVIVIFREKLITFPIINALLKKFYYPPGHKATEGATSSSA